MFNCFVTARTIQITAASVFMTALYNKQIIFITQKSQRAKENRAGNTNAIVQVDRIVIIASSRRHFRQVPVVNI